MLEANDKFGKFEFRPLEPGFGVTIGNALRRILLSSLEGYAINTVKIAGVEHEFSSVPGCDKRRGVFAGCDGIDRPPVGRDDCLHIFGIPGAAFYLEAGYAGRHKFVDETKRAEILGGHHSMGLDDEGRVALMDRVAFVVREEVHRLDEIAASAGLVALATACALAECIVAHEAAT